MEANRQSCPLAHVRNLRPRTDGERESQRNKIEESEREKEVGGRRGEGCSIID